VNRPFARMVQDMGLPKAQKDFSPNFFHRRALIIVIDIG
jgi:hypothetical protein